MRLGRCAVLALLSALLSSCVESQGLQNARSYQKNLKSAFFDQINTQLAQSIDDPYSIPIFVNYGQTNLTAGGGFSMTPKKVWAPAGITEELPISLGAFSSSQTITATTQNYVKGMQVTRDLFAYATHNVPMDPADVQLLVGPPPPYGWLLKSTSTAIPPECQAACLSLGKYGRYRLFARDSKSYSDFSLLAFQAINLQQKAEEPAPVSRPSRRPGEKEQPARRPSMLTIDPGRPPVIEQPTILAPLPIQ